MAGPATSGAMRYRARMQLQVLRTAQFFVQREGCDMQPNLQAGAQVAGIHRLAQQAVPTLARRYRASRQHLHGRWSCRSRWNQKAEDLAARNGKLTSRAATKSPNRRVRPWASMASGPSPPGSAAG